MKRFLIDTSVENAEGTQTWFVDAETKEEALDKFSAGGCDLYESNVEVTRCGEPEISGEVPLDDFGRFAEQPAPVQPAVQEPVSGVVLRDGCPTLIQDKHIKETDQRLCIIPPAQPAVQEPTDGQVKELADRYGLDTSMLGALRNFADAYHASTTPPAPEKGQP
jgi:hypothetical protein